MIGVLTTSCEPNTPSTESNGKDYIDLGLPSGILWASRNEKNPQDANGLFTYNEAVNKYGKNVPTKEQWRELIKQCEWFWNGNEYTATGPNGNSILLPAEGYRQSNGTMEDIGIEGDYWSSTLDGSKIAWCFIMDSEVVYMDGEYCSCALSLRLVK